MHDIFNKEISQGDIIVVYASFIPFIGFLETVALTAAIFVKENTSTIEIIIPVIPIMGTTTKKLRLVKMLYSGECVKIYDISGLSNWQTDITPGTTNMLMYFSEKIKEGHSPDEIHSTTEYNAD